jgi:putative two-component system hydrogenase maturation factor HypX/HoxX
MRILLLTHNFNSLAQKIYAELLSKGHILTVEYDISDQVTESAVLKFKPDLLIAPFLKRAIPESVWSNVLSLIVHPGPPGDRGPSSLDWAILNAEKRWGVTIIEANAILDGGPIWAYRLFSMRQEKKGIIYRDEISRLALESLFEAISYIENYKNGTWRPESISNFEINDRTAVRQTDREIDWQSDSNETIIKKINSADGTPGVLTTFSNRRLYLYEAKDYPFAIDGQLGLPLAICDYGIIVKSKNGAITIGHLKEKSTKDDPSFKRSACKYFLDLNKLDHSRTRLELVNDVATIYFNFYNGAMGIKECRDLRQFYIHAKNTSCKMIVLKSESGFFSNGIHLNEIEAAALPADYAWKNINAMNDLILEIINTTDKVTIAIVEDNASAGGVLLARANDFVFASQKIILNPHYKNMGNLYGSEYWTYLLPKYLGEEHTSSMLKKRLPMEAHEARKIGLIDEFLETGDWQKEMETKAEAVILAKKISRQKDESIKPLEQYRQEELTRMRDNFYGFDPSFHLARYNFVRHVVKSKTPLHIAIHRTK